MGGFFYRYSENGGETWSDEAFQIHIPQTKIDKQNQWNGSVQLMWLVDKGFQMGNDAFVAFTKIGLYAVEPPTSGWRPTGGRTSCRHHNIASMVCAFLASRSSISWSD